MELKEDNDEISMSIDANNRTSNEETSLTNDVTNDVPKTGFILLVVFQKLLFCLFKKMWTSRKCCFSIFICLLKII